MDRNTVGLIVIFIVTIVLVVVDFFNWGAYKAIEPLEIEMHQPSPPEQE